MIQLLPTSLTNCTTFINLHYLYQPAFCFSHTQPSQVCSSHRTFTLPVPSAWSALPPDHCTARFSSTFRLQLKHHLVREASLHHMALFYLLQSTVHHLKFSYFFVYLFILSLSISFPTKNVSFIKVGPQFALLSCYIPSTQTCVSHVTHSQEQILKNSIRQEKLSA